MKKEPTLEIDSLGTKRYHIYDKLHREDGPAVEYDNGDKEWYRNGIIHREDGPAVECTNGTKGWYQNGHLHREDGPAVEYFNRSKFWYYEGQYINCSSQEEFEKIIRLKAFWQ